MPASRFHIGVSADFAIDAQGLYEFALPEVFEGHPHVTWELMPQAADDRPSAAQLDQYDGILALATRIDAQNLSGLKRLTLVSRWGVGYDRIDTAALTTANIALAITPDAVRRPVAEATLGLLMACSLNLVGQHLTVRSGGWRSSLPRLGRNVLGRTVGVIGYGNIAREFCRMAQGIGLGRILAHDPYASPDAATAANVSLVDLETLFAESDFVCVLCALTPATKGLVNAARLALMKPEAYLINTARGPIVDEAALIAALESNSIAGAALDVFEIEPLPASSPLRELPNVILAPHALAWTEELARDNSLEACRNLLAVAQGQAPQAIVNRDVLTQPGFLDKLARYRTI